MEAAAEMANSEQDATAVSEGSPAVQVLTGARFYHLVCILILVF